MPAIIPDVPVSQAALQAALDRITALESAGIAYVGNSNANPTTVANLLATYPASASYLGKYARVSNLYGSVDEIMRCRYDGVNYRWVAQRTNYNGTSTDTTGTVTITPLVTPPTVRFTGTLTGNINVTLLATNASIGDRQRLIMNGVLGVYAATVVGIIGTNVALLTGATKEFEYTANGWVLAS